MDARESRKSAPKILLQEWDLPPKNPDYLTEITENKFKTDFGEIIKLIKNENSMSWRWVTVLPLYTERGSVLPLPVIIDTGAPRMLYMGTTAYFKLESLRCVGYQPTRAWDRFLGKVYWKGKSLKRPMIERLPEAYEMNRSDIRTNLVGLMVLEELSMITRN